VDNEQVSPTTPSYFDIVELPIKKPRARIELLRMICAFLSSKGGHIFLGIDSKNLQVKGINISTKQQDEFKFYIK
jgi:predicted HTH transcriptional regulator